MKKRITSKIKRIFMDNLALKLMALFFSILLWLIVVNVDDPTQTKTITTNVEVINGEVLTESGRYYEIPEGGNTVSFRVTAKRSVMERLTGEDFTATADMNYLEDDCRVPISIVVNNGNSSITISAKRQYLSVIVGNKITTKHDVEIQTMGEPAEGCVVAKLESDPANVSVAGPEELVNAIAKVVAYVDVQGVNEDMLVKSTLHFLNQNGEELDQSRLDTSYESVTVYLTVANIKSVPVQVETIGTLPQGLYLESVTIDPTTVKVTGDAEVLNEITEITVKGSLLDLSKITENLTTTVDLNTYLPNGVKVAEGERSQAVIKVVVSGDRTKTYKIPTANLTIRNLAEGCKAVFDASVIEVEITGKDADLSALDGTRITGYIDISGLGEGSHSVAVNLDLESGLTMSTATTGITIVKE